MKRFLGVLFGICILLSGCGSVNSGAYRSLEQAVLSTAEQSSGQIDLVSNAAKQDDMYLSFCYCFDADDVMHYCAEQTDQSGRRLFLEHNDGKLMQRWLLGHGTSSFDDTGTEFTRYTRERPYKYFALLCDLPQKDCISGIVCEEQEDGTTYTVTVDPQKIQNGKDADETLSARVLTYRVTPQGLISEYKQESTYTDAEGNETVYTVTLTLSKLGEIKEVPPPQIG